MGCWKVDRQQPLDRPTMGQPEAGRRKLSGFLLVRKPVKSSSYPRGISISFLRGISISFLRGISISFGLPLLIEIFFNLGFFMKSPVVSGDLLWKTRH